MENDRPVFEEAAAMSGLSASHPTDFALLLFTAGESDEAEQGRIGRHVEACGNCRVALNEIRRIDEGFREIALAAPLSSEEELRLPAGDLFEKRPDFPARRKDRLGPEVASRAIAASERASEGIESLLAAGASPEEFERYLAGLSLADPATRYRLLYSLEEMGRRIVDAPAKSLRFAEQALTRLRAESLPGSPCEAEMMVPLAMLAGQAHLLAGQTSNWTGELEKGRAHLEAAYRFFSDEPPDEIRLALTEYHESQRRSFAGKPAEGLFLIRRALRTLEIYGIEEWVARARGAEGIALSLLGRDEEAVACFRAVAPIFESHGLWRNYVSAVNSLGTSLGQLGRVAEARREYSHALRKVSREKYPALLAFTRHGLASLMFSVGHYADAAKAFGQARALFQDLRQVGDALIASLYEIESWARSGDTARAFHRLDVFRAEVDRREALDPFIVGQLGEALSGRIPDFERVAELRRRAEEMLRENLKTASA
jgi:tetratricopeptide (TPR) repeat protein